MALIDLNRSFADDYRANRDPDRYSAVLYEWHKLLWSRVVEGVAPFSLEVLGDRGYTIRLTTTDGRTCRLASDGLIQTWSSPGWHRRLQAAVIDEILTDRNNFYRTASTIGGYLLWPLNGPGETGQSINQARGTTAAIADRFDLTLECVRRHYLAPEAVNPLGKCLNRYAGFFKLFTDFDTYVRFWLLDDMLTAEGKVRSFMTGQAIDEFRPVGIAQSVEEYVRFREGNIAFVQARNERIRQLDL